MRTETGELEMLTLITKGHRLLIEWRHISKMGKRAQLHKGAVKAITTCTVVALRSEHNDVEFIASDTTLCSEADNFSRREGRKRSLRKLLSHCGALKDVREFIWAEWLKRDPAPERVYKEKLGTLITHYRIAEIIEDDIWEPAKAPIKRKPSAEQISTWKAAGLAKRLERQKSRSATS
jgi:hypothetical protein